MAFFEFFAKIGELFLMDHPSDASLLKGIGFMLDKLFAWIYK